MNVKKIGIGLFLLILNWNLFSQIDAKQSELPTIIPPSPTVSSLMRFEEVPIDNYSGKPSIAFPIYTKQLAQGIVIPIALRYNTMALRIDERSGWTGTGWAMDSEAVISRTVRGHADELNEVALGKKTVGIYHNGFFELNWGTVSQNNQDQDIQTYLWNASGKGSGSQCDNTADPTCGDFDKELDLYQVSLFGKSARFVIVKSDPYSLIPKMLDNDANLKVDISYNVDFEIDSFTVTDTNGNSYFLNQKETSYSHTVNVSESQLDEFSNISITDTNYVSAWKISEIKTSNNNIVATFNYQNIQEVFDTPISRSESILKNVEGYGSNYDHATIGLGSSGISNLVTLNTVIGIQSGSTENFGQFEYNDKLLKPKWSKTINTLTINSKKISSISFVNDNTSIHFEIEPNTNHPEYTNSGSILKNIIIKKGVNPFKQFNLNHSATANGRLFLNSIDEEFTASSTLHYDFLYHNEDELPEFSNEDKDIWGYYSRYESIPIYKLKFSADKEKTKIGVLTQIIYPNGGIKEFTFESNSFSHKGFASFTDDDFALYNPDNWIKLNQSVNFDNLNSSNGVSNEILNFSIDREHELYLDPTIISTPVPVGDHVNASFKIYDTSNGNMVMNLTIEKPIIFTLPQGNYVMKFFTLTIPTSNDPVYTVEGHLYYKNFETFLAKEIHGGGLRIKEIKFSDSNDISIEKKIVYYYNMAEGEQSSDTRSTGVIDGFLTNKREYSITKQHSYAIFVNGIANFPIHVDFGYLGGALKIADIEGGAEYDIKDYLNNVNVSMTKNNYVGYGKVTLKELNNGKTVSHYTTPANAPTYTESYTYPFTPLQDRSHLHGAMTKQEVFNNVNTKLQEVVYNYNAPIEISKAQSLFITDIECSYTHYYSRYNDYLNKTPNTGREFMPQYSDPSSTEGVLHLLTPDGKYRNCAFPPFVIAPIEYEFYDHYFSKYLLQEKITKNYYYNSGGVPKILESKEEYQYNLTNYQLKEIKSTDSNNEIHKSEIYYVDDTLPAGIFTTQELSDYSLMSQNNMITTPIYQQQYKSGTVTNRIKKVYDEFNNLLLPKTVQTAKGEITANNPLEDRITYHSYDQYGNPTELSKVDGVHIVYIWGYNHTQLIAKIINATYAEVETILGANFVINEYFTSTQEANLRNGLSDAQVTTMEYLPLIGVSKITDSTGNEQTFHYDNFNRLQFVKDNQGNILSKNEYHYRN